MQITLPFNDRFLQHGDNPLAFQALENLILFCHVLPPLSCDCITPPAFKNETKAADFYENTFI
jgi:hypothetical protein